MAEKNNFISPLHKCCSKDDARPALQNVYFLGGYAYASDAHCLVKQGLNMSSVIDAEKLDGKAIHADNFAMIRKFDFAIANDEGVECKSADGQEAFFPYANLTRVNVPDFDAVLSKLQAAPVAHIGVTPSVVTTLLGAMYFNAHAVLNFNGAGAAILVSTPEYDEQVGLIMPVMLQEPIRFPE